MVRSLVGCVVVTSLVAGVASLACGGGGGGAGSGPGTGGSGTASEGESSQPASAIGACSGHAVECYKIDTISSCFQQKGCNHVTDDCRGKQVFCDIISERGRCLEQLGCFWLDENGAKVVPPTGTCTGTVVECKTYADQASCNKQNSRCDWSSSKSKCERDYSVVSECSSFNQRVMFPDEAQRGCDSRDGCTWVPSSE